MRLITNKHCFVITILLAASLAFPYMGTSAATAPVQNNNPVKVTAQKGTEVKKAVSKKAAKKKKKIKLTISKSSIILNKNSTAKLKVKKKNAGSRKIIWKSNRKRIVKVDQKGNIKALRTGKAKITARVKGTRVKAVCEVEVQHYKYMRMRTTGYCNCRRCAGRWAGHATASGRMPRAKHTIAVDPRLIRLGTKVQIGDIIYTAEDTGGSIKGHRIDVYYSSHRKANRHGVKHQIVKVIYKK